jgi:hypothetical protein
MDVSPALQDFIDPAQLAPEAQWTLARHFSAGKRPKHPSSPVGTLQNLAANHPLEQTINNINAINFSELKDICTQIGADSPCRPSAKKRI